MDIALTPQYETLVRQQVDSGRYRTAGDVIEEGLRLLQEQEDYKAFRLSQLRNELQVGLDDVSHGRTLSEDDVFAEFKLDVES